MLDESNIVLDDVDPNDPEVLKVVTDYVAAAVPKTNFAKDLSMNADTLVAAGNGTNLRMMAPRKDIISHVNPFSLKVKEGWNVRDLTSVQNRARIYALAQSIAAVGVQSPLTVHVEADGIYLTDGHRRLMATLHAINVLGAEIKFIPVMEEVRGASEADRLATQGVKNSGTSLEPLEFGELCFRLRRFGWTDKYMATLFQRSPSRIAQLIELRGSVTPEMRTMINEGAVKPSFAHRVLRRVNNDSAMAETVLAQAVVAAKSQGRTKASAKHLNMDALPKSNKSNPPNDAKPDESERRLGTIHQLPPAPIPETPLVQVKVKQPKTALQDLGDPKVRELLLQANILRDADGNIRITTSSEAFETLCTLAGLAISDVMPDKNAAAA